MNTPVMANLRRVGKWSFQTCNPVSHLRWYLVDILLYFRNREQNRQYIRDNVRDRIAQMNRLRWEAVVHLCSRAGPVRLEVGSAEEE